MNPKNPLTCQLALLALLLSSVPTGLLATSLTDPAWTQSGLWDDGQAEIAFYEVQRQRNQYGRPDQQQFPVGTYLVKHEFDPVAQRKSDGSSAPTVGAFKWALFYEIDSGAYQYKRSWVINVAQSDLRPLKASFTSFDWCSNRYHELAFLLNGTVESLARSDDYSNSQTAFSYQPNSFPVQQLPLLVRSLDFQDQPQLQFNVVLPDGQLVGVQAELIGQATVTTQAGTFSSEKITLRYAAAIPSIIGEQADLVEHYFRGLGPDRLLLRLEAEHYTMSLTENLRSAYWRENFYPRLERVKVRP